MMNWKNSIVFLFLTLVPYVLKAQGSGPARERVKTLKVAFITERLSLTSKEAQTFWPIYNGHEEKIEEIRKKERIELSQKTGDWDTLSDTDASNLLDDFQRLQEEKHKAGQKLISNLKDVLPAKKIILLVKAEEDFKKRLLQQFRKRGARR